MKSPEPPRQARVGDAPREIRLEPSRLAAALEQAPAFVALLDRVYTRAEPPAGTEVLVQLQRRPGGAPGRPEADGPAGTRT